MRKFYTAVVVPSIEVGGTDVVTRISNAIGTEVTNRNAAISDALMNFLPLAGGTLVGSLGLPGGSLSGSDAVNRDDAGALITTAIGTEVTNRNTAIADAVADYLPLSGGTLTGNLTLNGSPSSALHAATKAYVDAAGNGTLWLNPVRVLADSNASLTATGSSIDGILLVVGDRVLLTSQTDPIENGVYEYLDNAGAGALTRSADLDDSAQADSAAVFVNEGTYADECWRQTATAVVGTDAQTWTQFAAGGSSYTAGDGIDITSNVISVKVDGATIDFNGSDELEVVDGGITNPKLEDNSVTTNKIDNGSVTPEKLSFDAARKFTAVLNGDDTTTDFTVNHDLNVDGVIVQVRLAASPFTVVECEIQLDDSDNVGVNFTVAPATGENFIVVIIG